MNATAVERACEYLAQAPPEGFPAAWLRGLLQPEFPELADDAAWAELLAAVPQQALGCDAATSATSAAPQRAIAVFLRDHNTALMKAKDHATLREELSPLRALAELWEARAYPDAWRVLNSTGAVLATLGSHAEAEPILRRAVPMREASDPAEDPGPAECILNLGYVLAKLDRPAEAEPYLARAVALRGKGSVDKIGFANTLHMHAVTLRTLSRRGEAEAALWRSIEILEKEKGPEDQSLILHLNLQGLVLSETNRLGEAEECFRMALKIAEAHPDNPLLIANSLNNISSVLYAQRDVADAEAHARRAVAIVSTSEGISETTKANFLHSHAVFLMELGRLDEAEPLLRQALATTEAILGPNHADTAVRVGSLASILVKRGQFGEAEKLYRRVIEIDRNAQPQEDAQLALHLANFAAHLHQRGRRREALPLIHEAVAILDAYQRANGHPHPFREVVSDYLARVKLDWTPADGLRDLGEMLKRRLKALRLRLGFKEPS